MMNATISDFLQGRIQEIFIRERDNNEYVLENVLPYRQVEDLDFEHIIGEFHEPIIAEFSGFSAEGKLRGRDGFRKFIEELRPIKQQMSITGKDYIMARKYKDENRIISRLFNDTGFVYDGVRARAEKMRAEVLSSGVLSVNEGGQNFSVDYQVPDELKIVISTNTSKWSDTVNSNPIQDMINWLKIIDFTPEGAITSRKIKDFILMNEKVRKMINGTDRVDTPLTLTVLNNFLSGYGLPVIVVDEDKYRTDKNTKVNFWPENKFVWVGADIGETLMGPTAEQYAPINGSAGVTLRNGIYIQTYNSARPIGIFTTASATSLVSLPGAEEIFIAQPID
jgi:hypothetical protein